MNNPLFIRHHQIRRHASIINNRAYNQLDFYSFDVDDGGVG
ncbi:Uncharacterised protein [Vibrio cholerae]|nr:Uncharacterised protein [Vibrio cholerae]